MAGAKGYGWYPRSIIYASGSGKMELFLRAVTMEGFKPLGILLGIKTPQELVNLLSGETMSRMLQSREVWRPEFTSETLNLSELGHVWGKK
jgi:hypothetical protein